MGDHLLLRSGDKLVLSTGRLLLRGASDPDPDGGGLIRYTQKSQPSYKAGYAKSASESAYPELWDALEGAWIPSLGNSGDVLRNAARSGVSDGAFESLTDSTIEWGPDRLTFSPSSNKSYINCGVFDKLDGSFSVTAWLKPQPTGNSRGLIGSGDITASSVHWSIVYRGSDDKIDCAFDDNVSNVSFASTSTFPGGTDVDWVHVAVRKTKGVGYELFINGRSEATGADNGSINTGDELWIGRLEWLGSNNGVSTFGDVGPSLIYSRALSNDEISLLASDGPAPFRQRRSIPFGVTAAPAGSVGSSAGTSTAAATGASSFAAVGSASGTATASGVSGVTSSGVGSAAGTSTAAATGKLTFGSTASASGVAVVTGVSASTAASVGASAGIATVTGLAAGNSTGVGSAAGTSTVAGVGTGVIVAVGSSAGTSVVTGVGQSAFAAVGSAAGTSTSAAIGKWVHSAIATAAGTSTVTGLSPVTYAGFIGIKDYVIKSGKASGVIKTGKSSGTIRSP